MKARWNFSSSLFVLILVLAHVSLASAREPRGRAPESDSSALDQRIRSIRARNPITVPFPDAITSEPSQTPRIEIYNNTGSYLMIYFRGPSPRQVRVRPGASESVVLTAGSYEVAAEVDDPSVLPFFGLHQYDREGYRLGFSIRPTPR